MCCLLSNGEQKNVQQRSRSCYRVLCKEIVFFFFFSLFLSREFDCVACFPRAPRSRRPSLTLWSSSLVHGPLMSSGLRTFCHRCWHCTSVRFWQVGAQRGSQSRLHFAKMNKGPKRNSDFLGKCLQQNQLCSPSGCHLLIVSLQLVSSLLIHEAPQVSSTSHPGNRKVSCQRDKRNQL